MHLLVSFCGAVMFVGFIAAVLAVVGVLAPINFLCGLLTGFLGLVGFALSMASF